MMRRPFRPGHSPNVSKSPKMSRELDWLVDEWTSCAPQDRLRLLLAKIRAEEKLPEKTSRQVV